MKVFLLAIRILVVSIITAALILFTCFVSNVSCSAVDAFLGEASFHRIINFYKHVIFAVVTWFVGLIIYIFKPKQKPTRYKAYFIFLTTISLAPVMKNSYDNHSTLKPDLVNSICQKSSDDGMEARYKNLSKREYDYLNTKRHRLPEIPEETESVSIYYVRDDFFGEFDLNITLKLNSNSILDSTNYKGWKHQSESTYNFVDFQH